MRRLAFTLLAVLAAGETVAAEPLGRLFFTPEQRAQMDVARAQRSRATLEAAIEEQAPLPEIVTFHGIVRRSDGKSTVWMNDRAINDGAEAGRLPPPRPRADGSIMLELPQSERRINLKVGQSVELLSGTIAEPYARAPVPPKPGAGKPQPSATRAEKERDAGRAEPRREEEEASRADAGEGRRAASPPPAAGAAR